MTGFTDMVMAAMSDAVKEVAGARIRAALDDLTFEDILLALKDDGLDAEEAMYFLGETDVYGGEA